jgi:hypothetical protein
MFHPVHGHYESSAERDHKELIKAIAEQTKAINALAESNQALVQAMIESGEIENGPQDQCL